MLNVVLGGCLAALVFQTNFDEGEGTVAKDASGNGLHAKLVNCTWEKRGLHGPCLSFNGDDSYIELPQDSKLDFTDEFTWSLWYKTDRPRVRFALFGRGGYANGWTTSCAGSYFQLVGRPEDAATCLGEVPSGIAPTDPWIHLTITAKREAAGPVVRFYVDGKQRVSRGIAEFLLKNPLRTPAGVPFTIGKNLAAEAGWFKGIIDNVSLYDTALTSEQVLAEHVREAKPTAEDEQASVVALRKIDFAPLQRKRVAIFVPAEVAGGEKALERPSEWLVKETKANGCQPTVLNEDQLCDLEFFNARKFDTLVLACRIMPFFAEDSIFQFLMDGGNLMTITALPSTYKIMPDGTLDSLPRDGKFKRHPYGWYAPFLVRENPSPHVRRERVGSLMLDSRAVDLTGDLLPAKIGPRPNSFFRPLDKWDKTPSFEGGYGDPANYALAADERFALYAESTGIGADFTVYRYHNALINGATMVQLGTIGAELLKSEDGARVYKAALHLLEAKLPDAQSDEFYADAVQVQKEWGEFSFEFEDAYAALRDAAAFTHTLGGDWPRFTAAIDEIEARRQMLDNLRKRQVTLVWSNRDLPTAFRLCKELLAGLKAFRKDFADVVKAAKGVVVKAKTPAKPAVKSKYGTLPSIASSTWPMNLHRARHRLFQMIKRIGSNIWSGGLMERWFTLDPKVQQEFKGLKRDFKFLYTADGPRTLGCGKYSPTTGAVTEGTYKPWPYEVVTKDVARLLAPYMVFGTNNFFRIGTGDETGLGYAFWDSHAAEQFREYLKERYQGDVAAMNAEMMGDYKSFADVQLPLRQPKTPFEHALWENWRLFREKKLVGVYNNVYEIVKKQVPSLEVYTLPSYGALSSPLFAVDYYKVAASCDMFGIDGTCCSDDMEWVYADLSGKPFLTSEWGGLYQEASPQYVHSKLWQELIAGSLGFEQHIWSWGGESCAYVDEMDLATINGGILKSVLDSSRKFDWLFLDGKRAVPEVAILYSQTSRMHDQGWGYGGSPRISEHVQTVCNYYRFFLGWGHATRVLDEYRVQHEADILTGVKAIVVPQALYLDEKLQMKLVDFAKQGGKLVLEGRVGAFTPFGKESDLIFRETGLMPFASEKPVRVAVGKGEAIFLGQDAGKEKSAAFPSLIEGVLRDCGIGERIACSDEKLFVREWVYGGRHFVALVSRAGTPGKNWGEHEVEIAIRGQMKVTDYLLGAPVKAVHRDGYTVFKTLAVNGGRVLELSEPPADPNPAALKRAAKYAAATVEKRQTHAAKETKLPFSGHFFDDTPLTDGNYVLTLSTISSGRDRHDGETYLTVSAGSESLKKRIFENVPTYFPMRRATYRVTSRDNFCMYPFYADALIERVSEAEPANKAEVRVEKDGKVLLKGDFLEATFVPSKGAEMCSFKLHNEQYEQLVNDKAFMVSGSMPGAFRNAAFSVDHGRIKNGVKVAFAQKEPSQGVSMVQTVAMADDKAEIYFDAIVKNASGSARMTEVHHHPELTIGTSADAADRYIVPRQGLPAYDTNFRGRGADVYLKPLGADWAAIVDSGEKLALVARFSPEKLKDVYIYEAAEFYTLELESPLKNLKPDETVRLTFRYQLYRGLSGVDDVQGDFAAHLVSGKTVNQFQALKVPVEVASTRRESIDLTVRAYLKRGDAVVAEWTAVGDRSVSFNQNANLEIAADLSKLDDGDYTLEAQIAVGKNSLTCVKPIELVGTRAAKLIKRIESLKGQAKDFAARVALFNAEKAAKAGDIAGAEKCLSSLGK